MLCRADDWVWRLVLSTHLPGGYGEVAAMPFLAMVQAHVQLDIIDRLEDVARRKAEREAKRGR